ncbi:hypothetical protein [Heyndrickxia acidicola]|uniref:Uncharacterized protein n=1 Tax=Heyndrickxia acidicola TaxID=209389 RepID=A0ABU6MB00_9BACI|nr:hypothetical protein [Heyndrickxia acidicola]MED1201848.1 hypothetical protein [Heyndrickxia acidicola]
MALTLLCTVFYLFCLVAFYILGFLLYRKNKIHLNKPNWTVFAVLFLQVSLFVLFWEGAFEKAPGPLIDIVWWSVVGIGFIARIRDFKNNFISAIPCILLSLFLAGFMLLLLYITSM